MNKKGFIFYELLISFVLLSTIIYSLLVPLNHIMIDLENKKLTYQMKQTLALNVILIENKKPLQEDTRYHLKQTDNKICISWWDLYDNEKEICENLWL